jgi:hypothetical protein
MSTAEMNHLTDAELEEVSGGRPSLGGYTVCSDGLYVGGCPPTLVDAINAFVTAFHQAAGR